MPLLKILQCAVVLINHHMPMHLSYCWCRLDQRSVVDFRVELQDLERFSIINRFARFHGRSPSDVSGASSSDPLSFASRPVPQRYVIALPMPRNLPENLQCLSLWPSLHKFFRTNGGLEIWGAKPPREEFGWIWLGADGWTCPWILGSGPHTWEVRIPVYSH